MTFLIRCCNAKILLIVSTAPAALFNKTNFSQENEIAILELVSYIDLSFQTIGICCQPQHHKASHAI